MPEGRAAVLTPKVVQYIGLHNPQRAANIRSAGEISGPNGARASCQLIGANETHILVATALHAVRAKSVRGPGITLTQDGLHAEYSHLSDFYLRFAGEHSTVHHRQHITTIEAVGAVIGDLDAALLVAPKVPRLSNVTPARLPTEQFENVPSTPGLYGSGFCALGAALLPPTSSGERLLRNIFRREDWKRTASLEELLKPVTKRELVVTRRDLVGTVTAERITMRSAQMSFRGESATAPLFKMLRTAVPELGNRGEFNMKGSNDPIFRIKAASRSWPGNSGTMMFDGKTDIAFGLQIGTIPNGIVLSELWDALDQFSDERTSLFASLDESLESLTDAAIIVPIGAISMRVSDMFKQKATTAQLNNHQPAVHLVETFVTPKSR
jgi:hypothetical protein